MEQAYKREGYGVNRNASRERKLQNVSEMSRRGPTNREFFKGTHRSAVAGTDRSARFFVDVELRKGLKSNEASHSIDEEEQKVDDLPVDMLLKIEEPAALGQSTKPKPKRFQNYTPKRQTAEELQERQRLAAERKQKATEKKVSQAKKAREEVVQFDKKMRAYKEKVEEEQNSGKKWYSSAIKFK